MPVERIARADDRRVVDYRDVPDPELLRSRGLFVAEGRIVVRRVIEDGRYRVRSLLVSEAARLALDSAIATLAPEVPIYVCEAGGFLGIAGYDVHRGCLALVERPPATSIATVLELAHMLIVVEGVTNADNIGGVFRNAAAFGADAVLLSPTSCDPLYRKAIRTSMAATIRVPFARASDWPGVLVQVRAAGFTIVALTPREPFETLEAFASRPRPARLALVLGTEGDGLTPAVEATADHRVRIRIRGDVDSLNLAVAAGIALYRLSGTV
jgi:tRNA G18 (ribose-2'-O)-methylase SpoU